MYLSLQHSYGFIQCCDREARLFFHFSEYNGNVDTMNIGGECNPIHFIFVACLINLMGLSTTTDREVFILAEEI